MLEVTQLGKIDEIILEQLIPAIAEQFLEEEVQDVLEWLVRAYAI